MSTVELILAGVGLAGLFLLSVWLDEKVANKQRVTNPGNEQRPDQRNQPPLPDWWKRWGAGAADAGATLEEKVRENAVPPDDIHRMPVAAWSGETATSVDMEPPIGKVSLLRPDPLPPDFRAICTIGWHGPVTHLVRFCIFRGVGLGWDVHLICLACAASLTKGRPEPDRGKEKS